MTEQPQPTDAELMPCPFCGEAAKHSFNDFYGDMSMACCKSCGAQAYAPKWNRRAVLAKWGTPAPVGAVPQGWKAVPVNPTPEMWKAAKTVPGPNPPYPPHYGLVWDAMLAAAPTPPTSAEGVEHG